MRGNTPQAIEEVLHRFEMSRAKSMPSARNRLDVAFHGTLQQGGSLTVLQAQGPLIDPIEVRSKRRSALAPNADPDKEGLDGFVEVPSIMGADIADHESCESDVREDNASRSHLGDALALQETDDSEAGKVVHARHRKPAPLEGGLVERDGGGGGGDVHVESFGASVTATLRRLAVHRTTVT